MVINRSLANELWPGDPLDHVVRLEEPAWSLQFDAEIVGVTEDMRFSGLTSTPDATVFLPLRGNAFTLSFPVLSGKRYRNVRDSRRSRAEASGNFHAVFRRQQCLQGR